MADRLLQGGGPNLFELLEILGEAVTIRVPDDTIIYANRTAREDMGFDSLEEFRSRSARSLMDDYLVAGHRYFAEAVRELARKKINPVKVIIDGAHAAGLKVHVAVRPAGWSFVEPFTDFWETPLPPMARCLGVFAACWTLRQNDFRQWSATS